MKTVSRYISCFLCVILLLSFLFLQHAACFDLFDTNAWYLYLLALAFAVIQYGILLLVKRIIFQKWLYYSLAVIYAILLIGKLTQIIMAPFFYPYPMGLTYLCLCLDTSLCVSSLFHAGRHNS